MAGPHDTGVYSKSVPLDPPVWCWRSDQPPVEVNRIYLWTGTGAVIADRGTAEGDDGRVYLAEYWLFGSTLRQWRSNWRWMPLPLPPKE